MGHRYSCPAKLPQTNQIIERGTFHQWSWRKDCIEGVLSDPAEGCMFLTGGGQIMEIIDTGDLKRITYENTEDVTSTRIFQGIYGVGKYSLLFPAG